MEQDQLKEALKSIAKNNYEISEEIDLNWLTDQMLIHIGSLDSTLRDELIYYTFYKWIIEKKYYDKQSLRKILQTSLDNKHLFYGISLNDNDSVFTRSFSILIIPLILVRNRMDKFLSTKEIKELKEKVLQYIIAECDYRGYVPNKGWAHTIAHAADALDDIVQSQKMTHEDLIEILEIIKQKMSIDSYVYVNEEDERMVTAVLSIFKLNLLSETEIQKWIRSFADTSKSNKDPNYHNLIINIKSFLRSLYFRLKIDGDYYKYRDVVEDALDQFSNFN